MGLTTQKILGIDITTSSENIILEEVRKCFEKKNKEQITDNKKPINPLVIFTPNPEIIAFAQRDDNFRKVINTAQINLPDGSGVVWAFRKLYKIEVARISGADFMWKMVNLAEKESLRIGLIGGRGDLADRTLECLRAKHQNLKIEVFDAPEVEIQNEKLKIKNYGSKQAIKTPQGWQAERSEAMTPLMVEEIEDSYFNSLVKEIIKEKTDVLFVAFGFPKQEYFISNLTYHLSLVTYHKPLVLMAVGGSFDYISGRVPRAPKWIRDGGFEWLYRLIREPWRLPRQLKGAEFFWKILIS